MRNTLLTLIFLSVFTMAFAKKVKFSVDMRDQIVNITGVHVTGDFQDEAGYIDGDWQPGTTLMTKEVADTNIYSVIVDIPAFRKYEFFFINGIETYEAEFIPVESRVGYNFNNNRWIWVDSLADDTTDIGAIMFSTNAPQGKTLMRFMVNMQNTASIAPDGVHVAGNFQSTWNPEKIMLYSFGNGIYEIIAYADLNTYEFLYYNGNVTQSGEIIPSNCATNAHRTIQLQKDSIFQTVCFSGCVDCNLLSLSNGSLQKHISFFPNPGRNVNIICDKETEIASVEIFTMEGKQCATEITPHYNGITIEGNQLPSGIYMLNMRDVKGNATTLRWHNY